MNRNQSSLAERLEPRCLLAAAVPQFLGDVNTIGQEGYAPKAVAVVGGKVIAGVYHNDHGFEPFVIGAGTATLLKDIRPGINGGFTDGFVVAGDTAYFTGYDDTSPASLWATDGTPAGTRKLGDFDVLSLGAFVQLWGALGNTLFFSAGAQGSGRELWRSDGTVAGTRMVADLAPGPDYGAGSPLGVLGQEFIFGGPGGLWAVGEATPPRLLAAGVSGRNGVVDGAKLYFTGSGPDGDTELWVTDATTAGTRQVANIRGQGLSSDPGPVTRLGDRLYFFAYTDGRGDELWSTDGTAAGTSLVVDAAPSVASLANPGAPLVRWGDKLYFQMIGSNAYNDIVLGVTDGTAAGTGRVFAAGSAGAPKVLSTLNATPFGLAFAGDRAGEGMELWLSEGTAATTRLVKEILPGGVGALAPYPRFWATSEGLLFTAQSPQSGFELWRTDGTPDGTQEVADVNTATRSFFPKLLMERADGLLLLAGENPGAGLWTRDPATGTVAKLADLAVQSFVPTADRTRGYFVTLVNAVPRVAVTDGTTAGTYVIPNLPATEGMPTLTTVGGKAYLLCRAARTEFAGLQLWVTDGSAAGTSMLLERPYRGVSATQFPPPVVMGDGRVAVFVQKTTLDGSELWVSDGTIANTRFVTNVQAAQYTSTEIGFWLNDRVVFKTGAGGFAVTDGTATGTRTIATGIYWGLTPYARLGGWVYFLANRDELWRTDGTETGTAMVKDLNIPDGTGLPGELTVAGGRLYWSHYGVWTSDGTAAGTRKLAVAPGTPTLTDASSFTWLDGDLYCAVRSNEFGRELYRAEGGTGALTLVRDFYPGLTSGVSWIAPAGGTLYSSVDDATHGFELWQLTKDDSTPPAVVTAAASPLRTGLQLRVTFTEALLNPSASSFVVTDRNSGAPVSGSLTTYRWEATTLSAFVTLSPALPDGRYRLTLPANSVADAAGNTLAQDFLFDFHFFRGDMNYDGSVNNQDIAPFVQGLTNPAGFQGQYGYAPDLLGDVNRDGLFNNQDIAAFVAVLTGGTTAPSAAGPRAAVRPAARPFATSLLTDDRTGSERFARSVLA
jgi:ELWxxDGT repeat protein